MEGGVELTLKRAPRQGLRSPTKKLGSPMQDRKEVMKRCFGVMEWLDRLGYLTAGFSLLVLGMLIFAHAWYVFVMKAGQAGLLPSGLKLLNDLLLVIILLELFRTVIRFLQTEVLDLEPYLAVGIIACTRRVLTASAELSHLPSMSETQFYQYLMDVGLNVAVIMVLIVGVFMIRKRPTQSPLVSP
jgi:uncharacterized membrane protein (DUF373 family)